MREVDEAIGLAPGVRLTGGMVGDFSTTRQTIDRNPFIYRIRLIGGDGRRLYPFGCGGTGLCERAC